RDVSGRRDPEGPPVRVRPDGARAGLRVLPAGPRGRGDGVELGGRANLASDPFGRPHGPPGGELLQGHVGYRKQSGGGASRERGPARSAERGTTSLGLNRRSAMKVFARILAAVTFLLGAAGLLLSLAGGVGVWTVKGPVTACATQVFGPVEAALDVAEQGPEHAGTSLARGATPAPGGGGRA